MPRLQEIVKMAYRVYVSRMGREPAPMLSDFQKLTADKRIWVFEEPPVNGFIVMYPVNSSLHIENLAVDPIEQGRGIGRLLIDFAETHAKKNAIEEMSLYTNVHMTENLSFYPSLGYSETGRRSEDGFDRVYFSKTLDERSTA